MRRHNTIRRARGRIKPNSVYRNDHASYRATIDILTRARLEGIISFEAIHDPTRPVTVWNVHREVGAFIRSELDGFLKGYYRDLMQSQPNQIEIVGEKNAIDNVIKSVTMEYCIPYTIGRGYACLDRRQRMAQRYEESGKEKLVVLILTDFEAGRNTRRCPLEKVRAPLASQFYGERTEEQPSATPSWFAFSLHSRSILYSSCDYFAFPSRV